MKLFCPTCGETVANPAREGGFAFRKGLYDPDSGVCRALCPNTACKTPVVIERPRKRLVLRKEAPHDG